MGSFGNAFSFYLESFQRVMTIKQCKKLYNKAKQKRPGKSERDYFKIVLMTKPPYDYQYDEVLDEMISSCNTIEELSDQIAWGSRIGSSLWESRKRNMKLGLVDSSRNRRFYVDFWR